jgi:IS30 family transposase
MSYAHLSINERIQLELLHGLSWSTRAIGKKLGRHHSTIARELKRNQNKNYCATVSQRAYQERKQSQLSKKKLTPSLIRFIEQKLSISWSPEQIAGYMESKGYAEKVSFKSIYRWLDLGHLNRGNLSVLRHKGKRRQPAETRGKFNMGKSISQRPKEVRKRQRFGDWELDTVVSGRGKSKGCFATFVERKTRHYLAIKIPDRTSSSMEWAFEQLAIRFPKGTFQTATVDRGKEFACHEALEQRFGVDVYFADPYSSWQRGSNENSNGLLREFFPKGTDLAKVSDVELEYALYSINQRPRKCLGWKSTHELFQEELSHLA